LQLLRLQQFLEGGITNGAAWYTVYGSIQDWLYIMGDQMHLTLELWEYKVEEQAPSDLQVRASCCASAVFRVRVDQPAGKAACALPLRQQSRNVRAVAVLTEPPILQALNLSEIASGCYKDVR
jgi:hypothetical protein